MHAEALAALRCDPIAFALQRLPNAQMLAVESIRKAADACITEIVGRLQDESPWRLHAFAPWDSRTATAGRAKLLERTIRLRLQERRRSLLRTLQPAMAIAPFTPTEHLVQVGPIDENRIAFAHSSPADLARWRLRVWTHPGGVLQVPRDPRPPSRAYAKLQEALALFGDDIQPQQTVVDLGASPGGWSYVALAAGARVFAVDRAPLAPELMANSKLTFVKGDAFAFKPAETVDWTIADIAAFPERILELLEDWLGNRRCRRAVVTLKFTRDRYREPLDELKKRMPAWCSEWSVRRLLHNKNEATIYAVAK